MIQKITYLLCILFCLPLYSQKVGLVLSGGGAAGFAHIGVIKALEDNNIPIDYITGTSAGSLVGAMYAIGMTPEQMMHYIQSEEFVKMTKGELSMNKKFLLQRQVDDPSLIEIPFTIKNILSNTLPTNLVRPYALDFEMLKNLGTVGAMCGGDFDRLFIPFRCVASDISKKESVVFSKGNLNEAVRASLTYPFYINPIRVDGKLLFDGGLYNNFPSNVMYYDFHPDFIIGSTVTDNAAPPMEDNLISQVTNMLMNHSDFSIPCENSLILKPHTTIGTFNFEQVEQAILAGYEETINNMDKIKAAIQNRVSTTEIHKRRTEFKNQTKEPIISSVNLNVNDRFSFISKSIYRKNERKPLTIGRLEKRFFRLTEMDHIAYLYPTLTLKSDSTFNLHLNVKEAKRFKLEVGGHFSSRPVNIGYIALNYYHLNRNAWHVKAESSFGKFHSSARLAIDFQPAFKFPVVLTPYFILNRYDFYRSSTTFFENIQPSFLIQSEFFGGLKIKSPIGNKATFEIDVRGLENKDSYYIDNQFSISDTADYTKFTGWSTILSIEKNTLNRKQFANSGTLIRFSARYIGGWELTRPGSTSNSQYVQTEKNHNWINFRARYTTFFLNKKIFHLGVDALGVLNSQSLFSNYKASILAMTAFAPIPDMETYFLQEYRSPQYVGAGLNAIFSPLKFLDIRLEAYYFQPFKTIQLNDDGTFQYSKLFKGERYLASGSVIYHSPVGPVRFTMNYFHRSNHPFAFQFSFGYLLFNERSIR